MPESDRFLFDSARLQSVDVTFRASSGDRSDFDRLTKLGTMALRVPVCLVTLITAERQEFVAACGLPPELEEVRGTPLSYAICRLSVISRQAVVIGNAAEDERTARNPVVTEMGVRSYLGFPLMLANGQVLGGFCAIDFSPREWTAEDIDAVREFAGLAVWQLESITKQDRLRAALDLAVHDLRSPLSEIVMASSMFSEQINLIPSHLHPLLSMVKGSTENAIQLLENISRSDQHETSTMCEDPAALLTAVSERFRSLAIEKAMTIEFHSSQSCRLAVPPWVLEHVFENLISNAIKYGPPQSRIWVHYHVTGEFGHVRVRDEGPGFSEEDRKKLFQRYVKLSASPTGNEVSTGLGLSIAKRLAEQHGGSVALLSLPNESAEFEITFAVAGF